MSSSPIALLRAFVFCLSCATLAAHADVLQDARALAQRGESARAVQVLDDHLRTNAADAQARFLKGVILTEQNRQEEAIQVFVSLTQDFPDLAEPYNNLAVLYAGRGDFRAAREALDMAIRANPGYAMAYENLGDVHVELAAQAYQQALNAGAPGARNKLALARTLTRPNAPAVVASPPPTPPAAAAAPPEPQLYSLEP